MTKIIGFADKNYNRFGGNLRKNLTSIAPNYRMNELTGAVALAQLERLPGIFKIRNRHGKRITEGIKDIPGITPHKVLEGCESSFWLYMFRIDPDVFGCTAKEFSEAVAAEGIKCSGGYLPECVYEYPMFKNKSAFKGTHAPFDSPYYGGNVSYDTGIWRSQYSTGSFPMAKYPFSALFPRGSLRHASVISFPESTQYSTSTILSE